MLPKHHDDRITKRVLPWTLTLALTGVLYYFYSPYNTPETSGEYHTASEGQSLTSTEKEADEKVSNNDANMVATAENINSAPQNNSDNSAQPIGSEERKEKIAAEQTVLLTENASAPERSPAVADNQQHVAQNSDDNKPSRIQISRGEFEKHVLHIGATSNAWQSIQRKDLHPSILKQLTGLKKRLRHSFKSVDILYSNYVRDGKVDAANSKLLAIRTDKWTFFCKESHGEILFYDAEGNASEASMDRVPIRYTRISSPFNPRRVHPVTHRIRAHTGVDLKAAYGTPVASTGSGTVSFAGWQRGYGKIVVIKHHNGYETRYAHLSAITTKAGNHVKRGEIIGKLGNTGISTGAHVHYEVRVNGKPYNPMSVKLPSYKPLHQAELPTWKKYAKIYIENIDTLK